MCVIFVVKDKRPSEEMVEQAWDANSHGGGIAWREDDSVVWRKGLSKEDMAHLCQTVPTPYVAHFRIASVGGIKDALTHPFPIATGIPLLLEGKINGTVLFHNGHWQNWQNACLTKTLAMPTSVKVPDGPWSDSRALAWLTLLHGPNLSEFVDGQRIVMFSPKQLLVYGTGWQKIYDVWCSNDGFTHKHTALTKFCRAITCSNRNVDLDGYCPQHRERIPTTKHVEVPVGAGGGQQPVTPFRKVPTLAELKQWYDKRLISKSKFKQLQKCLIMLVHNRDEKTAKKANHQLDILMGKLPQDLRS